MDMKSGIFLLVLAAAAACAPKDFRNASLAPADRAEILLAQMTLEEKVGQMCQYVAPCYVPPGQGSPYKNIDAADENLGNPGIADKIRRGEIGSFLHVLTSKEAAALQQLAQESRLRIPLLIGVDAIHGNALHEGCTIYPTNINMASSFDPELLEEIGAQTALEMRRTGMYWTFAPNLDVARDARWGRMGETYGEDPYLVSQMGKHLIRGLQGPDRNLADGHVLACAKHLIGGGEPFGGINAAPMDMSERKLRELYLPPFKVAVEEAGVATVMPAHNELNGIPCHGNTWLLQDILRKELGFDGFVVSDWMDIDRMHGMHRWVPSLDEAFAVSVEAGVDMHMQGDKYFESVVQAVRSGRIPEKRIDAAVRKILTAKFALGLFESPVPEVKRGFEGTATHRETALQAAREGIVLLKNDGILPLRAPRSLFVTGPNADSQTILGDWAAPQPDSLVTTVLEGLQALCPGTRIDTMCFGGRISNITPAGIRAAAHKAAAADLSIVVVGDNSQRYSPFGRTCGENCDRDDIGLPGLQEELLEAVQAAGKPTVVVLMSGRALSVTWAQDHVNAILEAWEPGQTGGQAVAEILLGAVNPSGKLPVTFPRSVGQIQTVYNHKHSQYSRQFALTETGCLYPFGYGLGYSKFTYSQPVLDTAAVAAGKPARASVRVTNEGPYDGAEVVQLYIRDEYGSVTRPVKELKAFRRVEIKAGESAEVAFEVTPEMLQCWGASGKWTVEPGDFTLLLGSSSRDADLLAVPFTVMTNTLTFN